MATIDDVVSRSGYSRSTVFRYLAGRPVRLKAREAIGIALEETGYRPDRRIAPQDEKIGIVLSVPRDFRGFKGFADAAEGIIGRASEQGIRVTINAGRDADVRTGVIILGKSRSSEDEERGALEAEGVPCVLVNRMIEEDGASWVSSDFRLAASDAVRRLVSAGCRRLACHADAEGHRAEILKIEGFLSAAREEGVRAEVFGPDDGRPEDVLERLLSQREPVDGWLAPSDEAAMRIIRAARNLGLSLPRELSVIGMNDVEGAELFVPAITSIRIPFRACGAAAVDALVRLLRNPLERSVRITMKHRLVERESCAPVRT